MSHALVPVICEVHLDRGRPGHLVLFGGSGPQVRGQIFRADACFHFLLITAELEVAFYSENSKLAAKFFAFFLGLVQLNGPSNVELGLAKSAQVELSLAEVEGPEEQRLARF